MSNNFYNADRSESGYTKLGQLQKHSVDVRLRHAIENGLHKVLANVCNQLENNAVVEAPMGKVNTLTHLLGQNVGQTWPLRKQVVSRASCFIQFPFRKCVPMILVRTNIGGTWSGAMDSAARLAGYVYSPWDPGFPQSTSIQHTN